ncbi:unnamed protein product [Penicillium salamii]|nr:unnamed protein product [Penicillium salamii]
MCVQGYTGHTPAHFTIDTIDIAGNVDILETTERAHSPLLFYTPPSPALNPQARAKWALMEMGDSFDSSENDDNNDPAERDDADLSAASWEPENDATERDDQWWFNHLSPLLTNSHHLFSQKCSFESMRIRSET